MEVEIEYCVACGLLERAIDVERLLLREFGVRLGSVRLRTGSGGVFKVRADGEEIFDSRQDAWDPDGLRAAVARRLVARDVPGSVVGGSTVSAGPTDLGLERRNRIGLDLRVHSKP